MEDNEIIALYWARDEEAIQQTDFAYGQRLHRLAERIVMDHEDARECVSDTYYTAWDTIPPKRPEHFFAYLAKLCRNFSLGRLDWKNARKRSADIVTLTQEMEACIPDRRQERQLEGEELGRILNRFLESLSAENRLIFMRRYWYMDSIAQIAQRFGVSQSKVKTQLHRTRGKLRLYLEREGIRV